MKKALLISAILHICFLLFAFFSVQWTLPDMDDQDIETLPIKIAMISDTNSVRKGVRRPKEKAPPALKKTQKEKVEAKHNNAEKSKLDTNKKLDKWATKNTDTQVEPQSEKKEETALSKDEEKPKEELKKEPEKPKEEVKPPIVEKKDSKILEEKILEEKEDAVVKPDQKPKSLPDAEQKKEEKSKEDDMDKLIEESLLIDKTRTKGGGKNNSLDEGGYGSDKDIGVDDFLAQTLSAKISDCVRDKFNIIALGGGVQTDLKIRIRFTLNKDGQLDEIQEVSATGGDIRLQEIGINQARAALRYCSPFDLPRDKYQMWQQIDMLFDPYSKGND